MGVSLFLLFFSYMICNTSIPLPDEMEVLQAWDKYKSLIGINNDSIPNEVLLVNVSYDKELVYYEKGDIPLGVYAITDRKKLYDFLLLAQKANNYKYIMLDVIFEKGIRSNHDSLLFSLIASMDRIVIPVHNDIPLQDSILYPKSANADYTITWKETNFARFKFRWDDIPTMALRMYQDIDGKDVVKHGIIYTSNNVLCRNGITLQLPIKKTKDFELESNKLKINVLQLGADLLASNSLTPIANEIKDKIIVIGDLDSDSDLHATYAGPQPGSIINLNAYYALQRGDHIMSVRRLIYYLIIAFIYFALTLCYLNGFSLSSITDSIWLKALIAFGGIGFLFWIVAIIGYLFFDTVYNLWIPIFFFSVLGTIIYIYSLIKENEHAKKDSSSSTKSVGNECSCEQLQNPISE